MTKLETYIQLAKVFMMVIFLIFVAWLMMNGGIPCRIVG